MLRAFFDARPEAVFYEQQVAVHLESRFFHWITKRALESLAEEGRLSTTKLPLLDAEDTKGGEEGTEIRFYWHPKMRSWKRKALRTVRLVREIGAGKFGKALGAHAESQFDAALAGVGFTWKGRDVREWNGVIWPTGRELDRVYARDAVEYGAEIKNTLGYIPKGELDEKIRMCRAFGLRPLVIARSLPKHYVNILYEAGGYGLIFGQQLYPYGQERLAARVTSELGYPTATEPATRHVRRFVDWHIAKMGQPKTM